MSFATKDDCGWRCPRCLGLVKGRIVLGATEVKKCSECNLQPKSLLEFRAASNTPSGCLLVTEGEEVVLERIIPKCETCFGNMIVVRVDKAFGSVFCEECGGNHLLRHSPATGTLHVTTGMEVAVEDEGLKCARCLGAMTTIRKRGEFEGIVCQDCGGRILQPGEPPTGTLHVVTE